MQDEDVTEPAESTRSRVAMVWLQRGAGIVLGGLAGTAAAYAPDIWTALHAGAAASSVAAPGAKTVAGGPAPQAEAPQNPADIARQIADTLLARARDFILKGELREAERFIAAAAKLQPDAPNLDETQRLLDVAKTKTELARRAPATGTARAAPPAGRAADGGPAKDKRQAAAAPPSEAAHAPGKPAAAKAQAGAAETAFAEGVKLFRARKYNAALAALGNAAAVGYAPAQNYLGYMYRHGFGVTQNFAHALDWYHKAAAQGHAGAMNNIGYMYRHGLGVDQDDAEARRWFERAAKGGDSAGQFNLAEMMADGIGAAPDYRGAMKWYRAAADQGHPRAAMGIAHLYAQGLGITADPIEAYFWYGVAARNGVEGAERYRTAIGAQLTARQREVADGRLATWKIQSAERDVK
jgi:TPR repeat protein